MLYEVITTAVTTPLPPYILQGERRRKVLLRIEVRGIVFAVFRAIELQDAVELVGRGRIKPLEPVSRKRLSQVAVAEIHSLIAQAEMLFVTDRNNFV